MKKKQSVQKHQKANHKQDDNETIKKNQINAKLTIELEFPEEKLAKSVCEATSPENSETPIGTEAISQMEGKKIIFQVKNTSKFKDLISTVDDFLEKVEISRKIIENIKKE